MKSASKKIGVGLIGFGTIGQGVVSLLKEAESPASAKTGVELRLVRVCDTDLARAREVAVEPGLLTNKLEDILKDEQIQVGIELVGGVDAAGMVVEKLLQAGKHVVTANKALLASRGAELFRLADSVGRQIRFEASCAGGIPLVGALTDGLVANRIKALKGIVNGTCNYILTCMYQKKESFSAALAQAQQAGYAEADPSLDVNGLDSAHKLAILAGLAVIAFPERLRLGVTLVGIILIFITAVPLLYPRYREPFPAEPTLLNMMAYDHATGTVPRPTILLDKHTTDAHDNPVISLDAAGHVWIFSSAHGTARPAYVSVSKRPYDIDDFERVLSTNYSYPQPHYSPGEGFLLLHTRYGEGRRLYHMSSRGGRTQRYCPAHAVPKFVHCGRRCNT